MLKYYLTSNNNPKEIRTTTSLSSETASHTCSNSSISTYYTCSGPVSLSLSPINKENILSNVILVEEEEDSDYNNNNEHRDDELSLEKHYYDHKNKNEEVSNIWSESIDSVIKNIKNNTNSILSSSSSSSSSFSTNESNKLSNAIDNLNWENALKHMDDNPHEVHQTMRIKSNNNCSKTNEKRTERLPIHHACLKLHIEHDYESKIVAIQVINKLIDIFPTSLEIRESKHGCLPLHLLVYAASSSSNNSDTMIKKARGKKGKSIMVGYCKVFQKEDKDNEIQIENMILKLLKKMIKLYPKSPMIDSEGGRLPLHTAISSKSYVSILKILLHSKYNSTVRHRTKIDMNLPLHLLSIYGLSDGDASPDIVIKLLQAYPDGALGRNKYGRTPYEEAIFISGEYGRGEKQIQILNILRKHPTFWISKYGRNISSYTHFIRIINAASQKNISKNLEKHALLIDYIKSSNWSCLINELNNISRDEIESTSMLSKFITVLSRTGRIIKYSILHYICEYNPPLNVIKLVSSLYPSSMMRKSIPGDLLPIHISSTFSSPAITMYLLSQIPKTMHYKDELGNLPIHLLCYSSTQFYSSSSSSSYASTEEIIAYLLSIAPNCIYATTNFGSTPIDIISRLSCYQYPNKQCLIDMLQQRKKLTIFTTIEETNDNDNIDDINHEENINIITPTSISSNSGTELLWI